MNNTKNEIMKQMTGFSVKQERLMCLVQLASYMMGRINVSEGEITGNEEINKEYPGWLESVLDTASEIGQKQNTAFDGLIQMVDELQ